MGIQRSQHIFQISVPTFWPPNHARMKRDGGIYEYTHLSLPILLKFFAKKWGKKWNKGSRETQRKTTTYQKGIKLHQDIPSPLIHILGTRLCLHNVLVPGQRKIICPKTTRCLQPILSVVRQSVKSSLYNQVFFSTFSPLLFNVLAAWFSFIFIPIFLFLFIPVSVFSPYVRSNCRLPCPRMQGYTCRPDSILWPSLWVLLPNRLPPVFCPPAMKIKLTVAA